jgi:hypothetical protein
MVHQKNYIESEIQSSWDPEFVLTVQQILGDAASNQLKSGEAGNLQVCYRHGNCSVLKIIKNNRFATLTGNGLWESLMKWVGTRVAEEPGEEGREYVFGGMVSRISFRSYTTKRLARYRFCKTSSMNVSSTASWC